MYNTALEERIRVYTETKKGVSFAAQCRHLTLWRQSSAGLASLNAQSEQVTLKRRRLAFQAFFRRVKNGETPGFPRFKPRSRYPGWGYKTHGDGWKLHPGKEGQHGRLYLQGLGYVPVRDQARTAGTPVTCDMMHKAGKWFASVTLALAAIQRTCGAEMGAFDWGLTEFLTVTTHQGIETIANPRHLRNQLAELIWLPRITDTQLGHMPLLEGLGREVPETGV